MKKLWVILYNIHVYSLAFLSRIKKISYSKEIFGCHFIRSHREICILKIRGPISYFVALHEIGHANDNVNMNGDLGYLADDAYRQCALSSYPPKNISQDIKMICEYQATHYAIKHAIHFTPEMKKAVLVCLYTHERRNPERIPK